MSCVLYLGFSKIEFGLIKSDSFFLHKKWCIFYIMKKTFKLFYRFTEFKRTLVKKL